MLVIDGSQGEGGGQILRSSLALSMCLSKPFKIINIRATRRNPGLRPQHLMAVSAAGKIAQADIEGAKTGSMQLTFQPGKITAGTYTFNIGTAGSAPLVLQTVLPALLQVTAPSTLMLQGGTHNPLAPPYHFIEQAFVPLINRMGPSIEVTLERAGFYPKGGGRISVHIQPTDRLQALHLPERGKLKSLRAEILLAHLPEHIAMRESRILQDKLNIADADLQVQIDELALSPGNAISVIVESDYVTEVICGIGERGLPAEDVASRVVRSVRAYLQANVAVGPHLADQLVLPIALAGEGSFLTVKPSLHTLTNIAVIKQFMGVEFSLQEISPAAWLISL